MTLMKATNENWGLKRAGDWNRTEFKLDQNGNLHIRVFFLQPVVDTTVEVSGSDMSAIRENLEEITANPPEIVPEARDGEAWSFNAYDDSGKLIFKWKLSHIYGLEPLENIGRILDSYIPEYEKPEYKEEEIKELIIRYHVGKSED